MVIGGSDQSTGDYLLSLPEPEADRAFREEIRSTLAQLLGTEGLRLEARPPGFGVGETEDTREDARRFLRDLDKEGLAAPTWPRETGGAGLSGPEAAIVAEELARYDIPGLYAFAVGLSQVGPTIIRHGTTQQKDRWLPPMRSGEEIWCQLFSEPESGSDLASARASATFDPASALWTVTGEKTWSSRASYSDWGFLLARSSQAADKHRGLSVFGLPMRQPGVEIRPLRQMNGDEQFCSVHLEEAVIPDEYRIGDVNDGWTIAITTLMHERSGASIATGLGGPRAILDLLRGSGQGSDPVVRQEVAQVVIAMEVHRLMSTRIRQRVNLGGTPGPDGSLGKIMRSRISKRSADLVNRLLGPAGMLADHPWSAYVLTAPSMSIRGGTDEILHNLVGERVLGLPRDPRPKDIPT